MPDTTTTTLIVLAHPEPRSFTAEWARASAKGADAVGHDVLVSDLSGMGFDPVERASHYAEPGRPFDVPKAQEQASIRGRLPHDVVPEVEKLERADRVIFHFPLWWFSPPAMLKGWFERILVHGRTHDVDHRFDRGRFRGRKALFCVSTGANAAESGPDGKEGDTRLYLWPAAYTLRYLGFDVLEPVIVHGVHGYHRGARQTQMAARLEAVLEGQEELLARFDAHPLMAFNDDGDFGDEGRLLAGAKSYSPFIRRPSE
ncbi:MAG: NAD(P)H-dependent oxidoreductase [Boseongicola sp.]|nr:NAD(P)H-dependent oxidoreductase [Boseongicola sp.]